jgi:hypothetical protein
MSAAPWGKVYTERESYLNSRGNIRPQDLLPYAGQWVAWSADGTQIVAHHDDLVVVAERVLAAGIDSQDVILEWLPTEENFEALL